MLISNVSRGGCHVYNPINTALVSYFSFWFEYSNKKHKASSGKQRNNSSWQKTNNNQYNQHKQHKQQQAEEQLEPITTTTNTNNREADNMSQKLGFAENFMLSGVAAAVSKTAAAPIERVKLLVQNQSEMIKQGTLSEPYKGVIDCTVKTFRSEGK